MKKVSLISGLFFLLILSSCSICNKYCDKQCSGLDRQHKYDLENKCPFTDEQKQAVNSGDVAKIKEEINKGVDVNGYCHGKTALMIAAHRGYYDVAELLIKNGANVNAKELRKQQETALMIASREGRLYIVELLLKNGADTSIINTNGATALGIAKAHNRANIVKILEQQN